VLECRSRCAAFEFAGPPWPPPRRLMGGESGSGGKVDCRHWRLSRPPSTLRLKVAPRPIGLLLRSDFCRSRSLRVRKDQSSKCELSSAPATGQASNKNPWTVPPPLSIGTRSSTVVTPQRSAQASHAIAVGRARSRRRQCRARSGPVRWLRRRPDRPPWASVGLKGRIAQDWSCQDDGEDLWGTSDDALCSGAPDVCVTSSVRPRSSSCTCGRSSLSPASTAHGWRTMRRHRARELPGRLAAPLCITSG
jgi:hypothetical protein